MWIFYILGYYLIIWLLTFIGVKFDEKDRKYNPVKDLIRDNLRNGHIWWLIFPPVNIIAAITYFIRGISSYLSRFDVYESLTNFLFGKKREENGFYD